MLGPYANTSFRTHQFDRLAASSLLLEFAFTDSPDLEASYQSIWGRGPKFSQLSQKPPKNELVETLANSGVESILFTDDDSVSKSVLGQQFDRVIEAEKRTVLVSANDPSETRLADFFAAAIELAAKNQPGTLLWLHSQGLCGPWDAPYEMRRQFADEEDPDPPTFTTPPGRADKVGAIDPDELLGYQQSCSAQIVLMDQFLGILIDQIEALPKEKQPLLILTSPRGFPLGSRGVVGLDAPPLIDESIHVPVLVRRPDRGYALSRNQSLVYSACVGEFLIDWLGADTNIDWDWLENPLPQRRNELVVAATGDMFSLRTFGWKFVSDGESQSLFVKPDDRWELNNVWSKCRHVGFQLEELADEIKKQIVTTGTYEPFELDEQLAFNFS